VNWLRHQHVAIVLAASAILAAIQWAGAFHV
jgi:hypothetical protein